MPSTRCPTRGIRRIGWSINQLDDPDLLRLTWRAEGFFFGATAASQTCVDARKDCRVFKLLRFPKIGGLVQFPAAPFLVFLGSKLSSPAFNPAPLVSATPTLRRVVWHGVTLRFTSKLQKVEPC